MIEVTISHINPELACNDFDLLLPLVSHEKQDRIKRFHAFRDKRNCLLGDILVQVEISRITGLKNAQLHFAVNERGKPYLIDCPNIHFNISHSGDYIACAISEEPVGIDIEQIKSADIHIAHRFFAMDEVEYIQSDDANSRFYEVWTMKESRIKLEGLGLYKPLSSFSVFDSTEQGFVYYHEVLKNKETICYVCTTKKSTPTAKLMSTHQLMKYVKNELSF